MVRETKQVQELAMKTTSDTTQSGSVTSEGIQSIRRTVMSDRNNSRADNANGSGHATTKPAITTTEGQGGRKVTFMEALEGAKDAPQGGGGNFLRLADKETVEVVFVGDALEIKGTWRDNRFVPWRDEYMVEGLRRSVRYALSVIKLDERRGMVLEVNRPTFLEMGDDLAGGIEEVVVKLRRIGGRGDPKSRITARPVRNLRADESDALDTVSKPNLETLYAEFLAEAA